MTRDVILTALAWAAPYLTAAAIAMATLLLTGAAAWARRTASGRNPAEARHLTALATAGDD